MDIFGEARAEVLEIYTTKNAKDNTTIALTAGTVSNHALSDNCRYISIKSSIEDVIYLKFKNAVGDSNVSTTNYDQIILNNELSIDLGRYETTSHISILSATAGDVYIIER